MIGAQSRALVAPGHRGDLSPCNLLAGIQAQHRAADTIYAVGDAIEVTDAVTGGPALVPLAGPASRQGRAAADHLFGHEALVLCLSDEHPPVYTPRGYIKRDPRPLSPGTLS